MIAAAAFPPNVPEMKRWFAGHESEWISGTAYRFAIELDSRFVGMADIDGIRDGSGSLGYWLDPAVWGMGIATEAAHAVALLGFDALGLMSLRAGHAGDNFASGRVLVKLGFEYVGSVRLHSRSRGMEIDHCRYVLRGRHDLRPGS
jgi:RimJ/RimL family protein N-acetyltransferase